MSEIMFCIQYTPQTVGNSALWWRVGGHGYTCNIDEAWIVGEEQAKGIEAHRDADKAWPVEAIEYAIVRHVDVERLP